MLKSIKYLFVIVLFIQCTSTQKESEKTITSSEVEIAKNLIQGSFDDLRGGADSTKILNYHTEDFVILEHGEIWDNDRIKEFMRSKLARPVQYKRINKMDYISIDKYGESMQIAYWNDGEFYDKDSLVFELRWLESALAVTTEKGWRLKMMHSTRVQKE